MAKPETIHDRRSSDLPINSSVSVAIVSDPYSTIGEKITVLRSVRDDPLASMHSRRQIDDAQLLAGRKWQRLYEKARIGPIQAMDPGKPYVDGGRMGDPLTVTQMAASDELNVANVVLGKGGEGLVRDILGNGLSITQAATGREYYKNHEIKYVGHRFKTCLESLAILWGFAQPKAHR